ncbi:MAG: AAA family ATPase [Candidatus Lokiarchaeota archaeon]|nr:AAA family ATPase [Candidatus Lokiarchaeota archaeon]
MIFPIPILNAYFKRNPFGKGIVSVWGDFGVGKTTFALQTLYNTNKKGSESIYIFTKPTFPYERINRIMQESKEDLDHISFVRLENFNDLHNLVFNLEFLILKKSNTKENLYKLIVIDSLTDLYRLELNREKKDMNYNLNYRLNQILANLFYLSEHYDIDILVINEKVQIRENDQNIEIQSGGKVMEYWVTLDIKIERTEVLKEREIILTNHSNGDHINFRSNLTENGFQ